MIVEPKVRGFMCTTAHPEGCKAAVREQIDYINSMPKTDGPKFLSSVLQWGMDLRAE